MDKVAESELYVERDLLANSVTRTLAWQATRFGSALVT